MDPEVAKLLLAEYLQLQKMVEDFDSRALTIKAWSVTLSAAGLVAGYTQHTPVVLIVSALSALMFWLVEGLWKLSQQAFYARVYEIENAFQSNDAAIKPLQIASSWSRSWHQKRNRRLLFILCWPHVALPHVLVAVFGFALYWLAPPH